MEEVTVRGLGWVCLWTFLTSLGACDSTMEHRQVDELKEIKAQLEILVNQNAKQCKCPYLNEVNK